MEKTYYSNGKLLITGEYLVLDGAKSLALPTKFGQYLNISSGSLGQIHWTSFDYDQSLWFKESISCLLYTSPSPRDRQKSRMPSSA